MKNIKKLALAAAIATAPFTANALEALDDDFLGDITGQEGISIDKNYQNTIEEFKYIDGDGSDGTQGSVSLTDIEIGEFTDGVAAPFGGRNGSGLDGFDLNGALTNVWERGQKIDAAANGVLITGAMIGEESIILDNQMTANVLPAAHPLSTANGGAAMLPTLVLTSAMSDGANFANVMDNALSSLPPTDASGNVLIDQDGPGPAGPTQLLNENGDPIKLRATYGNGKDIRIGGIELGYAGATNGATNSIGTLHVVNINNYASMNRVQQIGKYFTRFNGATPASQADTMGLIVKNSEKWIQAETLISSKSSGTGVVIVSEGGLGGQAVVYTDTDGAGENQVGVIGMASFRFTDNNLLSDDNDTATGQYLRGAKTTTTIDVEDGKLKLHQVKDGNTVLGKIFIGDVNRAQSHLVARADKGVIGGISILGNHWEGTTYISGH